jgi:hypothetical protein
MHSIEKPCPARGRTGGSRNERRKNSRIGPDRHCAIGKNSYDKGNLTFLYIGLTDYSRSGQTLAIPVTPRAANAYWLLAANVYWGYISPGY